jgi:hypothetical protein
MNINHYVGSSLSPLTFFLGFIMNLYYWFFFYYSYYQVLSANRSGRNLFDYVFLVEISLYCYFGPAKANFKLLNAWRDLLSSSFQLQKKFLKRENPCHFFIKFKQKIKLFCGSIRNQSYFLSRNVSSRYLISVEHTLKILTWKICYYYLRLDTHFKTFISYPMNSKFWISKKGLLYSESLTKWATPFDQYTASDPNQEANLCCSTYDNMPATKGLVQTRARHRLVAAAAGSVRRSRVRRRTASVPAPLGQPAGPRPRGHAVDLVPTRCERGTCHGTAQIIRTKVQKNNRRSN